MYVKHLACKNPSWTSAPSSYIPSLSSPQLPSCPCQHLNQMDYTSSSKSFLRGAQSKGTKWESFYAQWLSHTQKQCNKFKVLQTKWETHSHPSTPPGSRSIDQYVFLVSILCGMLKMFTTPECLKPISSHLILLAETFYLISFIPSSTRRNKYKHFICIGYLCCKFLLESSLFIHLS